MISDKYITQTQLMAKNNLGIYKRLIKSSMCELNLEINQNFS